MATLKLKQLLVIPKRRRRVKSHKSKVNEEMVLCLFCVRLEASPFIFSNESFE